MTAKIAHKRGKDEKRRKLEVAKHILYEGHISRNELTVLKEVRDTRKVGTYETFEIVKLAISR